MLEPSSIALISYPPIIIGLLGLVFCFVRDISRIKKGRGRALNTAPEIYWFMMVLVIVGLFLGFSWKVALLSTVILIFSLHPLRKKTKLKAD